MIKIHELNKERKTVTVTYQGQTGEVVYSPQNYTAELEEKIAQYMENQMPGNVVASMVGELVLEMPGIVDEKGEALTPTSPLFKRLPSDFHSAIMKAINEDMRGNDPKE
jgi:hypothetical protein